MKVIPIALAGEYASRASTICQCLKITRTDGVVLGFSTLDVPITVSGQVYEPGIDASSIAATAGLSVDNLELTIVTDEDDPTVSSVDLLAGQWTNAKFQIFEVNYEVPADGINILKTGTCGEVQVRRGDYVVELRGLTQGLQQPVGMVTQRTCRANFADFPEPRINAPCRLDPEDWTVTGEITAVTSNQLFSDEDRTEPNDWFGNGILTWTGGLNAGYRQKVKAYTDEGEITLMLPMLFPVEVGDTYSMIAGCRKRLSEDCKDKFNNVLNFQGEPHLMGVDALVSMPD